MNKHGEELGRMNAELIKALQANRERRRAEREGQVMGQIFTQGEEEADK